jgi:hypothetical protein
MTGLSKEMKTKNSPKLLGFRSSGTDTPMLLDVTYPAAFLVGLLGGVHCAGMCGGIVGATLGLRGASRSRDLTQSHAPAGACL